MFNLNGYLFLILSNNKNNRKEYSGSVFAKNSLTDTSGNIATTPDGEFLYVCIQKLPSVLHNYSRYYIPVLDLKEEKKRYNTYSTFGIEVSNICGPGNSSKCGTCCVYYDEINYNPLSGATANIGDLYGCFETNCSNCVDLSNRLGMESIFHLWGSTGATSDASRCLSCDSETSINCGPCACSVDLTTKSYYDDIINNKNISTSTTVYQNAKFEKINQEDLSGGIATAWIDLRGYSEQDRKISNEYKEVKDLFLPLLGNPTTEAKIRINTVVDSSGNKILQGFSFPENHGSGYVSVDVNSTVWNEMFPNIGSETISLELIPVGGFLSNMHKMFNMGMVISKVIKREDIESTGTIQNSFNQWSVQELYDENGMNVFSSYTDKQTRNINLSPVINATKTGVIELQSSDLPNDDADVSPSSAKSNFSNTTINDRVKNSKISEEYANQAVIEIESSNPKIYQTGDVISIESSNYQITSISLPQTDSGSYINTTKSNIHHIGKTSINTDVNPSLQQSWKFEIYFGSK